MQRIEEQIAFYLFFNFSAMQIESSFNIGAFYNEGSMSEACRGGGCVEGFRYAGCSL